FGGDEIVIEGIFDEERHAKEQRESADPREQLYAHELFPINCGFRIAHWPRRNFRRLAQGCEWWWRGNGRSCWLRQRWFYPLRRDDRNFFNGWCNGRFG